MAPPMWDGLNRINDSSVSLAQASSTVLSAIGG